MEKTAVEFAVEKLEKFIPSGNQIIINIILKQAKEIEKQQIIDAYISGEHQQGFEKEAEQYYKETFKQK